MLPPPAGLILALGSFFEIHVLLVCVDPSETATDDTVSNLYNDNYTPTPWPVAFAPLSAIREMLKIEKESGEHTSTMVVCQDVDEQVDSFRSDTVWLLPESALSALEAALPLRLDSNVVTYADNNNRTFVELKEHYAVKGNVLSSVLGTFGEEDGLKVAVPSMWDRRTDWGGAELIGTAETWWPLIGLDEDNLNNITGLYADVINLLGESLNFT